MDELRKKVIDTFWEFHNGNLPPDEFADVILALIEGVVRVTKEEMIKQGWKSPEENKYRGKYYNRPLGV